MRIHRLLLGLAGAAVLTFTTACSDTRRAENTPADPPVASADRTTDEAWVRERDEYVTRRERELDDYDRRWENFKNKASDKSRRTWNEVKEESSGLRRELRDLKNATKENWNEAKRRLDSGWDRFETKMRDVFTDDDHPRQ
jgi:hypothetical protein